MQVSQNKAPFLTIMTTGACIAALFLLQCGMASAWTTAAISLRKSSAAATATSPSAATTVAAGATSLHRHHSSLYMAVSEPVLSNGSTSTWSSSPKPTSVQSISHLPDDPKTKHPSSRNSKLLDLNQKLNQWAQAVLTADTAAKAIAAAVHTETLWLEASSKAAHDNSSPCCDIISFNTVLKAYAKCCLKLDQLRKSSSSSSTATTTTTPITNTPLLDECEWNVALHDPAVSTAAIYTPKDAVQRATDLLLHPSRRMMIDTQSFNIVMDAWAKSRDPLAPQQVEDLLKELLQRHQQEKLDSAGDVDDSDVLGVTDNISNHQHHHHHTGPDTLSYNAYMDAYAYSNLPNRLGKMLKIYQHMERIAAQHAIQNKRNDDGSDDATTTSSSISIKPTIRTVNSLLYAYSRTSSSSDGGTKFTREEATDHALAALKLLRQQQQRYAESHHADDRPDVMTFATVMDCWARVAATPTLTNSISGDPLQQKTPQQHAESLFAEMQQAVLTAKTDEERQAVAPNIYAYTALMKTWARVGSVHAVNRCETLLNELLAATNPDETGGKDNGVGASSSPQLQLLRQYRPRANAIACTAMLQAYSRSRNPNKARQCLDLLQRMRSMDESCHPTVVSYNTAIDACARTRGSHTTEQQQTVALKIAFAILEAMEKDPVAPPNHVTFGTLLHTLSCLLPAGEQRDSIATRVFVKAKKAGQVDILVVKNLNKIVNSAVFVPLVQEMHDGRHVNWDKLPPSWSRNVQLQNQQQHAYRL